MDPVSPISIPPAAPSPESKSKTWLWVLAGVSLLGTGIVAGVFLGKQLYSQNTAQINSYDQCVTAKGSRIQESYPATCVTTASQRFVQPVSAPTTIPTEVADPTANWKTYTDHTFNFSIKYPNNWTAACKDPEGNWSSGTVCDLRAPNTAIDHGQLISGANIGVGVEKPNQNYKTLEEKVAFDTKNRDYQSTTKTINNRAGYLYTSSSNSAFVTKNGDYFVIVSWIPLPNTNQYKDTVDQILSTFKFLD